MQTPFDHGDKMELVLFEKKEHFFITKITEFRDGAGFPFKTIEIGKVEKPKAAPQVQPKKEGPVLTMNMKKPALSGAPAKQIAGGAAQLPAGKVQPKTVAANGTKQVHASGTKQVAGSGTKQVAGGGTKQLPSGGPKQVSANSKKKLAAKDAVYLPAGKKR